MRCNSMQSHTISIHANDVKVSYVRAHIVHIRFTINDVTYSALCALLMLFWHSNTIFLYFYFVYEAIKIQNVLEKHGPLYHCIPKMTANDN